MPSSLRLPLLILVAMLTGAVHADTSNGPGYDVEAKVQDQRSCLLGLTRADGGAFDGAQIEDCAEDHVACRDAEASGGELLGCLQAYRDYLADRIEDELESFNGPGLANGRRVQARMPEIESTCLEELKEHDKEAVQITCALLATQNTYTQLLLLKNIFGQS